MIGSKTNVKKKQISGQYERKNRLHFTGENKTVEFDLEKHGTSLIKREREKDKES